jgi:predicted nucleic acid-binding protein
MYLLDSNILLRLAQPNHPHHNEARNCVRSLLRKKEIVCIIPQVLFEFWVVATRPIENNGLGLSVENVKRKVEKAERFFCLCLDTSQIYREWLRLVAGYSVSGVKAHDARIVAAMKIHGLTNLVTFNIDDFKRFKESEIGVFTPNEVVRSWSASAGFP